jgi:hypothetical protein
MGAQPTATVYQHPLCMRRQALQVGAIGLLGLGMNHLTGRRDAQGTSW